MKYQCLLNAAEIVNSLYGTANFLKIYMLPSNIGTTAKNDSHPNTVGNKYIYSQLILVKIER